jgi:tRNA 2-thiouridine synthesizing protein D
VKYAIQINASPMLSVSPLTGFQFIKAALDSGHEIVRVFFYHDGVFNAFISPAPPDIMVPDWSGLARENGVELVYCLTAATRRGMLECLEGLQSGGLGQWVDACLRADRVLVLGS